MITNTNKAHGMLFSELCIKSGIDIREHGGDGDPVITDIVYDSRQVTDGALYVAIPGIKVHGDQFINSAINNGALAVLSENAHPQLQTPWVQTGNLRKKLGVLGKALWDLPLDDITFIGITGTNGKTTVAHLYKALYTDAEEIKKTWMFGTIDYHIDGASQEASHTTPEALHILRSISRATVVPKTVVMEVSSIALALDRIGGIQYDYVVFTNLTQDHLDFHSSMDEYLKAKSRLFTEYSRKTAFAIINIDDEYGRRLTHYCSSDRCITYGRAEDAVCRIVSWECSWDGCQCTVEYNGSSAVFNSSLRGFFNIYNMCSLIAGAYAAGYDTATIQRVFDDVPIVKGRMERILPEAPFAVVIDYAHTPDALSNVLHTARELTKGRLFCVFGCGGDRDRTKRPLMGEVVASLCDDAWITNDNPRSEDPAKIIDDIVEGIPLDFPYTIIMDRKEAIRNALRKAKTDDCVVIAGKGHETYQEINGTRHHFDDTETAELLYHEITGSTC